MSFDVERQKYFTNVWTCIALPSVPICPSTLLLRYTIVSLGENWGRRVFGKERYPTQKLCYFKLNPLPNSLLLHNRPNALVSNIVTKIGFIWEYGNIYIDQNKISKMGIRLNEGIYFDSIVSTIKKMLVKHILKLCNS